MLNLLEGYNLCKHAVFGPNKQCTRKIIPELPRASLSFPFLQFNSLYMFPVRGSLPPPPPHMVWSQNLRFAAFRMKTLYLHVFALFFAWWVAGAVRKPANSLDFCNQPSENVLFAMFWLRHRGVVQPRPLLFLCQLVI